MIENINYRLREIEHREGPIYVPSGVPEGEKNDNRGKGNNKEIRFQKVQKTQIFRCRNPRIPTRIIKINPHLNT